MLLVQGPHLKNHWPRPMVWDIWHEYSDEWSGTLSTENLCTRPLCYCFPGGCWSPPASMVTSSQPSCNEPLPPHHLGGNVHQVFLLTPGHREGAWSKPWRGLALLLDQQKGVAGKAGGGGVRMRSRAKIKLILAER